MTNASLTDSAAPSNGGDQAPTSNPPAADAVPNSQPASDAPAADPAAPAPSEPAPAEPNADGKPGEPKPPADNPPAVEYEIKLQDGVIANEEILTELKTIATEAKLPPEAAQKLADLGQKAVTSVLERQMELVQQQVDSWEQELRNDKEFGGDKLTGNLAVAAKAVETFATPALRAMLGRYDAEKNPHGLGLGNHPEVVKFFHAIGSRISEDGFVTGSGPGSQMSVADKLYDNPKSKK